MIRSTVRSTIVTLSALASAAPIEAITATFIIVTLTYFQLLHAIKGSEFFQLPQQSTPARPVHLARLSDPAKSRLALGQAQGQDTYNHPSPSGSFLSSLARGEKWAPLPASDFRRILESNALEGGYTFAPAIGGNAAGDKAVVVLVKQLNVAYEEGESAQAVGAWQDWVLNDVGIDWQGKRYTYQDLCLQCDTKLVQSPIHRTQSTLTMYLRAPAPDMPTLSYLNYIGRLPPYSPAGSNTTFRLLPDASNTWSFLPSLDGAGLFTGLGDSAQSEKEEQDGLAGLRNVRWFAYAARAFVMRFWTLAKVSLRCSGLREVMGFS